MSFKTLNNRIQKLEGTSRPDQVRAVVHIYTAGLPIQYDEHVSDDSVSIWLPDNGRGT